MKSKVFGTLVAGAVTSMFLANVALADDPAPTEKKPKHEKGWCKSNDCAGKIEGAKNSCKGKQACKGLDKEKCEASGAGTWETGKAPKKG